MSDDWAMIWAKDFVATHSSWVSDDTTKELAVLFRRAKHYGDKEEAASAPKPEGKA